MLQKGPPPVSALPSDTTTTARIRISDFGAVGAANYTAGLASGGDRDWIAIDLVAGHSYRFEGALSGNGAEVSLRLANAVGTIMGTASAIAGSGNASLLFTATASGTWYIDMGSANGVAGTYDVVAIDTGIRPISSVATLTAGADDFTAPDATIPGLTRGLEGGDDLRAGGVVLGQQGADDLTAAGTGTLLYGGDGNDVLRTGFTDTFVSGGRGNDSLIWTGNTALDVDLDWITNGSVPVGPYVQDIENVTGGGGNDQILGTATGNRLDGGDGADLLDGRGSNDILYGGDGDDVVLGGTGDDHVDGGNGADTLEGGDGNDIVLGGAGDDVIRGGAGDDYILAGAGADHINGGAGNDTVSYIASDAGVTVDMRGYASSGGDAEGDSVQYVENLIGSVHNDVIYASYTDNGIIIGGAGADRITSAAAIMTYASYETSTDDLVVDLGAGVFRGAEAEGDRLINVRGIIGGSGDDVISAVGISLRLDLDGGAGDDVITGGQSIDMLRGGSGHDELRGGNGGDRLYADSAGGDLLDGQGSAGGLIRDSDAVIYEEDVAVSVSLVTGSDGFGNQLVSIEGIETAGGDDIVDLGAVGYYARTGGGDDTVIAGAATHRVEGGSGYDILDLSFMTTGVSGTFNTSGNILSTLGDVEFLGIDTVHLGSGDDVVTVYDMTAQDGNSIYGGDGNDTLTATGASGAGNPGSRLEGEAGDDVLLGREGADKLLGGAGYDTASYAWSSLGILIELGTTSGVTIGSGGYAEGDTLIGIEAVIGSASADRLYGSDADNTLAGRNGDDILLGRGGADTLTGGEGADRFVYSAAGQSTTAVRDTITDFSRSDGDRLDMANIDADAVTAGNQAFAFLGTDAFSGTAGELRVLSSGINALVQGDVNGDGVADLEILLLNVNPTTLTAGDFIL